MREPALKHTNKLGGKHESNMAATSGHWERVTGSVKRSAVKLDWITAIAELQSLVASLGVGVRVVPTLTLTGLRGRLLQIGDLVKLGGRMTSKSL